jgi:hypothetical protein
MLASAWPGIAIAPVDHVQRVPLDVVTWIVGESGDSGMSFTSLHTDQAPSPHSQLHGPEGRSGS